MGLGAVVLPGLTVGARSVVGAGAVVIEDVPAGVTVVGVPARRLAKREYLVFPSAELVACRGQRMTRLYLSPPHMGDESRACWRTPSVPTGSPRSVHTSTHSRGSARKRWACRTRRRSRRGRPAIHLALQILGVGPGDTRAVLDADVRGVARHRSPGWARSPSSWTASREQLEHRSGARRRGARPRGNGTTPKAVIAVDLYGQAADLEPMAQACRRHGVELIEDAAEALGAHLQGTRRGLVRTDRRLLLQRQQDHHDLGRRHAGVGGEGARREGALPGAAGPRPRSPLPALGPRATTTA